MSIQYTYELIAVDKAAKCMEIIYRAEGHPTMHVGARLPFEGESIDTVIAEFSPVAHWQSLQRPLVTPPVGFTGVITPTAEDTVFSQIFPTPASGSIDRTVFE